MDQRTKQRLVGAVVLVALAVIFIPMLLQGPVEREPSDVPIAIPPKPVVEVPQPAADRADAPVASQPFTPATPVDAPTGAAQAPAAPEPTPPPATSTETQSRTPPELAAWAVQVGSFSAEANAMNLRESLRRKGYPAYVEMIRTGGSSLYRVRIGPTVQREEAEKLLAAVSKKESLKGLVVPHP